MTILDMPTQFDAAGARLYVHGRIPCGPSMLVTDAAIVATIVAAKTSVAVAALFTIVVLGTVAAQGTYQRRFSATLRHHAWRLVAVLAIATIGLTPFLDRDTASRLIDVLPFVALAAVAARGVVSFAVRRSNRLWASPENAIIVGAGSTGVMLVHHLNAHPEYGISPIGFVDRVAADGLPLPLLGDVAEVEAIVESTGARQLIVAFGVVPEIELVGIIRRCQSLDVNVWVIPRFFELGLNHPQAQEVWGIPLAPLHQRALRGAEWRMKRIFDLVMSAFALVVLAPMLLAVALAVRLSSAGPIFFRQTRVGQRGSAFEVLKFRTMSVNDDSATTWSVDDDDRVTAVGRVLRRTCLDELPQLINVLRGDMSLVGPRPERPYFVEKFRNQVRFYDDRHRVPVGLTGLAQVHGLRGDTSIDQRAVFDNNYIENWSLSLDIAILLRTVLAVLRPPRAPELPEPAGVDIDLLSAVDENQVVVPARVGASTTA